MHKLKVLVPGTVLLDIYADSDQTFLGGAEFNFAYHVHHLMGGVDFLGRVGQDEAGRFILKTLNHRGFPVRHIQSDPNKRTKTVTIKKDATNEPIFIIPNDVASEYLDLPLLSDAECAAYALVYFGTTLQHGDKSRDTLRSLLQKCSGIKFCDINLRPNKHTPETILYSLHACDVLKLNHEELETIAALLSLSGNLQVKLQTLSDTFQIPTVCLTMASKGSMLYHQKTFYLHPLTPCSVKDTVGAGDGFSACLAIGLLQGWNPETLLTIASDFAGTICQIQGAVPASADFYLPWKNILYKQQAF